MKYSFQVYNSLLGEGMSSKLFQEIREKRGLVYTIVSFGMSFTDTGAFNIYAGTGEKQIKELIPALCNELKNSPNTISEKEINKGKAQLKAGLLMARESANNRARAAANQLLIYNKVFEPKEIVEKINKVDKQSIEKIANNIFSTPITIASIGPIKNLEKIDKIRERLV